MEALETYVRQQILEEGPQHETAEEAENYVDAQLTRMSNGALLTRISDALYQISGSQANRT